LPSIKQLSHPQSSGSGPLLFTAMEVNMRRAQSIVEQMLRKRALETPSDIWLKFHDDTFNWSDVLSQSQRVANGLLDQGVRPGDHVGIMAGNSPEFLWFYFGTLMIGGKVVPLNKWQRGPALKHMLSDSDLRAIAIDKQLEDLIVPLKADCPNLKYITVLDGMPRSKEAVSFVSLLSFDAEPNVTVADAPAAVSLIYTSGTTGKPKGIVADHYEPVFGPPLMNTTGVLAGETIYAFLPLFHANALMLSCIGSIRIGARLALADGFSASRFWDDCRKFEAVEVNLLGSIAPILLKQQASPNDRSHRVRTVLSVGCPAGAWREFENRFGVKLIEFYGMSDAPGNTVNTDGIVGSAGTPVDGAEFRIVDEQDRSLPPGSLGEIVFRHPAGRVTRYNNLPELTDEAYRGGWFHSGDLGEMDADGYLYFRGRFKEAIRRRGENISAWEIEAVVDLHPSVTESAAVGVPAELGEEEVLVLIVPQPGRTVRPEEILEFCKSRLAYFAMPRFIEIVDSLPKTSTQKIQHLAIKERGLTDRAWDRERAGYKVEKV
jgi:crotonobetaine/carnitine-CoA ligase